MHAKATLTEGPVGRTLAGLAGPMTIGFLAIMGYNLADTFFVARLGTRELAAMSFTFPVVMVVMSMVFGMCIGTSAVVSRAIGEGDRHRVQRLTTDCLMLAVLLVVGLSVLGYLTVEPLFRLLGASPDIIPLIREYMTIWYLGSVFFVIPMVGNNALRANGDARRPSIIMSTGAVINLILDPIMIFGLLGCPAMGLKGAALATVFSQAVTLVLSLYLLDRHARMLSFERPRIMEVLNSWRKVLFIALPAAFTNFALTVSIGLATRIVAEFGEAAVAGFGAGSRVQNFALLPVWALQTSLVPFMGQNRGSAQFGRMRAAQRGSSLFSMGYALVLCLVCAAFAGPLAALFSTEPEVKRVIMLYLRIVPAGNMLLSLSLLAAATMNALHRPYASTTLTLFRTVVLYLPLIWIGARWIGVAGVMAGTVAANCIAGVFAALWVRRILRNETERVRVPVQFDRILAEEGEGV